MFDKFTLSPEDLEKRAAAMAERNRRRAPVVPVHEDPASTTMRTLTRDGDSDGCEPQGGYPLGDPEEIDGLDAESDAGADQELGGSRRVTEGDAGRASALGGTATDTLPMYRPAGGRGSPLDRTEALVPGTRLTPAQRDAMPTNLTTSPVKR